MAYSQSNLCLISSGGIDSSVGGNVWKYTSADPIATVVGAGYFTNGVGMRLYDIVWVIDSTLGRMYPTFVSAVRGGHAQQLAVPGQPAGGRSHRHGRPV